MGGSYEKQDKYKIGNKGRCVIHKTVQMDKSSILARPE